MEHTSSTLPKHKVKEIDLMAGLKLLETEVRVNVPVFEDYPVKVPKFVEEEIKIPVGFEELANKITEKLSTMLYTKLERLVEDKLTLALAGRIKEIEAPVIKEVCKFIEVEVEKPVFKEVIVEKPVYKEKEIINPVLINAPVTNAVIVDKHVTNAIIEDVRVNNAIIRDIPVDRAIITDRIVEVIHKTCLDSKGNRLPE